MSDPFYDAYYPGNIYYASIGTLGFKWRETVDLGGSYEFDIFVAAETEGGELVYADDSGCSCPTPFEFTSRSAMGVASDLHALLRAVDRWHERSYEKHPAEVANFKSRLRDRVGRRGEAVA